MRRKKFRNNGKKQKAQERIQEQRRICREIFLYTQELTEEMNLRLLLDWQALCNVQDMLYVESIAVTGVRFPNPQRKPGFLARMGKKVTEIFTRIRNYIR